MGWFLSSLIVGLSFGLGVLVGRYLWAPRPLPQNRAPAPRPLNRFLAPAEQAEDAPRPIDDLIADLVAAPESVTTLDLSDAAVPTSETAVIRHAVAATATIPAVRTERVTEVIPAVPQTTRPAERTGVTEVIPTVATEPSSAPTIEVQVTRDSEPEPTIEVQVTRDPEPEPTVEVTVGPGPEPEPTVEVTVGPGPEPEPDNEVPDDLRRIEGIGPKLAGALNAAGVTTFAQLAEADPPTLTATLREQGVRFAPNLDTWITQARLLADGDEEGFTKLAAELVANRRARARR